MRASRTDVLLSFGEVVVKRSLRDFLDRDLGKTSLDWSGGRETLDCDWVFPTSSFVNLNGFFIVSYLSLYAYVINRPTNTMTIIKTTSILVLRDHFGRIEATAPTPGSLSAQDA